HGIAGLLVAPLLDIDTTGGFTGGHGTIGDIVRTDVLGLGLTNNFGWFFQDTGLPYAPNTMYTLTADVFTGGLIQDAAVLSGDGVGIGLTNGGDHLFASTADFGAIVSLDLLDGDFYKLTLKFTTGNSAPLGN